MKNKAQTTNNSDTNTSCCAGAIITKATCHKNEQNDLFSLTMEIKRGTFQASQLQIEIFKNAMGGTLLEKRIFDMEDDKTTEVFDDLSFKSNTKYVATVSGIGRVNPLSVTLKTSIPELKSVSYILDMEIVKKYEPNYSPNFGITKIVSSGDILFNLSYSRDNDSTTRSLDIPHDQYPHLEIIKIDHGLSSMVDMQVLQLSERIYSYIEGKIRERSANSIQSCDGHSYSQIILGPWSKTIAYEYIFPELKAPEGKSLFSISDDSVLTLNWYTQSLKNGLLDNYCLEFRCILCLDNASKDTPTAEEVYNRGSMTYKLSKNSPVVDVSVCFSYNIYSKYRQFGEEVTETLILIIPNITQIECHRNNVSFSLDVSWDTEVNVGKINQIKIIVSSNESVIREEYCPVNDGQATLKNLDLSSEMKYTIAASYCVNDQKGTEVEGKLSSPIEIIQTSPKGFIIEYKKDSSSDGSDESLDEDYGLYANWKANSSLDGEYIEIEYTDNQLQTSIIEPDLNTTPPLQITKDNILQARIRQRLSNLIGPWSEEVTVPYLGISNYEFDNAGKLLSLKTAITTQETQINQFEYDDRGNVISKKIAQINN